MNSATEPLQAAVAELRNLVAKDGGDLSLVSYDPNARAVTVSYQMAEGDDCASCAITPDIMQAFLAESFRVRGAQISTITLESPESAGDASDKGAER